MRPNNTATLYSLIQEACELVPNQLALVDATRSLTYGQLDKAIQDVEKYLLELGVSDQSPIMIVGENSIALCVLLLASAKIHVCVVMENARRVFPEISKIIDHSCPSHIFYLHENSRDAENHAMHDGAETKSNPTLGRFSLKLNSLSNSKSVPSDLAALIYTSGSTGKPKGVMLTHENLSYIARMMRGYRGVGSSDRIYAILPFTHVMGCASVLLGGLHSGATLFVRAKFDVAECIECLTKHKITMMQGAPAMFSKILEYCSVNCIPPLTSLRFLAAGGAPLDLSLKSEVFMRLGAQLHNGYGLTEAASISWTRMDEASNDDSVGRPLEGVEIIFRDALLNQVNDGQVGELWCRGPNLMLGYFDNPELTKSAIDEHGWFNTQDLGYKGPDGRIYIVGRTKELIIKSGFNVYPLEIEALLNAHPCVMHSAVIGRAINGNEEIHAFVEMRAEQQNKQDVLAEYLSKNLSPYKRPDQIHILKFLPLSLNGKVLKSQLASTYL